MTRIAGLRDRAILSVGLQVGFRRAEIAALNVGDLHQNRGFDALRVIARAAGATPWRSTRRPRSASAPILSTPATATARRAAVPAARGNGKPLDAAGRMDPDAIDRVVRKYAAQIGLDARLLGALDARDVHHDRA